MPNRNRDVSLDLLKGYIGGQLEIEQSHSGRLFRGQIIGLKQDDAIVPVFIVEFEWLAEQKRGTWYASDQREHTISLLDIEEVSLGGRLFYAVTETGEWGTFFPPDGALLSVENVVFLTPAGEPA